jgi:4-amino-4-deoxy-L-arabinose transferase-like glycosyltransferase
MRVSSLPCFADHPIRFIITLAFASLIFMAFYHAVFFPQTLWDTFTVYAYLGKEIYYQNKIPLFFGSSGSVEWSGNYPMLVPTLYAWFNFSLGEVNDFLSRTIFPIFGLATLASTYALSRKLYGSTAAIFSVYVLITTPIFFAHLAIGYIDIVLTFYTTLAFYFLQKAYEENNTVYAVLSGLLAGFAAWTKYQGLFLALIILAFWLLIRIRGERSNNTTSLFLKSLIAFILIASPWYLRNWILVGNPVYPNMFMVFGGRNLDPWLLSQNYEYWIGRWAILLRTDRSFDSLIGLPTRLLIEDNSLNSQGQDGVGFLLTCFSIPSLFISLFKCRKRDFLLLTWIIVYFLLWFASLYYFIRYLLPITPALSILAGKLISEISFEIKNSRKFRRIILSAIVAIPISAAFFIPTGVLAITGPSRTFQDYVFFRPFNPPSTEESLKYAMPADTALWEFINERTPSDSVLLSFDHRAYFINRKVVFADSTEIKAIYLVSNLSEAAGFLHSMNITHIVVEPWYKDIPLWYKSLLFRNLENATYFTKVFEERGYVLYKVEGSNFQ